MTEPRQKKLSEELVERGIGTGLRPDYQSVAADGLGCDHYDHGCLGCRENAALLNNAYALEYQLWYLQFSHSAALAELKIIHQSYEHRISEALRHMRHAQARVEELEAKLAALDMGGK